MHRDHWGERGSFPCSRRGLVSGGGDICESNFRGPEAPAARVLWRLRLQGWGLRKTPAPLGQKHRSDGDRQQRDRLPGAPLRQQTRERGAHQPPPAAGEGPHASGMQVCADQLGLVLVHEV